ncbi:MAG: HRDC domain-containing protein [Candidatus Thalassarchaeaceae archaeon]
MFAEKIRFEEFQDDFLREELRNWRLNQSRIEATPAFCIFPNKVLDSLVKYRPMNKISLRSISGIGSMKISKYGAEIIEIISMCTPEVSSKEIKNSKFSSKRLERKYRRVRKVSNEASDEIRRRMESGEFGSPPDLNMVNNAWAEILENEMSKQGRDGTFTTITGMWKTRGGKVSFKGRTQEDIMIPAGTKILALDGQPDEGSRQPDLRLVMITYND